MAYASATVRWIAGSVLALVPLAAGGCGGNSSTGSSAGCGALQTCCNAITSSGIAGSCLSTLMSDQALPDSDQTCTASIGDYQSYCSGAGADGGFDSTAPEAGGPTSHDAGQTELGFTPSNVNLQGIDTSSLVDVDIPTTDCTINTGFGGISCASNATVTQSIKQNANGVTIFVLYVKSFKIESNAVLSVSGNNPLAIVSLGPIDIEGQLLIDGQSSNPGAGGCEGILQQAGCGGPSNNGGGQAGTIGNSTWTGGSGGGYCGAGGAGGAFGGASALPGGVAWGNASLIPFAGGSSGGGANDVTSGGGGGAIQLIAKTSIIIGSSGSINAGGGGGGSIGGAFPGAGGGSGGAILLEAPSVTIAGAIGANGGGGGSGDSNAGGDATPNSTPAAGGSASGSLAGGSGAAGSTASGGAGKGSTTPMGSLNNGSAGGGGGGAGRIRINSTSGNVSVSGTVSPSLSTSCATQGKLGA